LDVELKEFFYRVLGLLYRYADEIAVLEYPRRMERRSIDLAVQLRDGRKLLVKVAIDASQVPRSEVVELVSLAGIMGVAPLIVAQYKGGEPLIEGVVYDRGGVKAVNLETLDNVLSGREQVFIYEGRDSFRVSIDPEKLREKRLEKGLSLGDLALILGVSRKAAYEYEKGAIEPSLEKAEKLVGIFGEDIVRPVDLFEPPREVPRGMPSYDSRIEEEAAQALEAGGFRVVHARRTVVDLGCSSPSDDEKMLFVVEHPREKPARTQEKIAYLDRLSNVMGVDERIAIVSTREKARMFEREGIRAVTVDELRELVRRRGGEQGA